MKMLENYYYIELFKKIAQDTDQDIIFQGKSLKMQL